MKEIFKKHSSELQKILGNLDEFHSQVEMVVTQLKEAFMKDKKVLIAGNGGSAEQAQHLSDEMVGRYKENRPAYPVIALTADSAVLTCIGNDFGYEYIFSRQLEALGKPGDIFIGLSTSGTSKNIMVAVEKAHDLGMTVIGFTGQKGDLKGKADYAIVVPTTTGARMQELHLHAIHLICEAFEPDASQENN